ncbi:zinc finger, C2H2 type [Opisthorchis viverrini]|uniref:Zinc finger, C2H2 type n=1 Tax=Opisthorchis viverrini TaxID=6198 RepID=A0A1S8WYQ6_OPIVI|nr:zinc finger, C2H2 type [Opisthorchis viverrini]
MQRTEPETHVNLRFNQDSDLAHQCINRSRRFPYHCRLRQHFKNHLCLKKYKCDFRSPCFRPLEGYRAQMVEHHWWELIASERAENTEHVRTFKRGTTSCGFCRKRIRSRSALARQVKQCHREDAASIRLKYANALDHQRRLLRKTSAKVIHVDLGALDSLLNSYAPVNAITVFLNLDTDEHDASWNSETSIMSSISRPESDFGNHENIWPIEDSKFTKCTYRCTKCFRGFPFECRLRQHLETHLQLGKYKCDFCPSGFRSLEGYKAHMTEQHWAELVSSDRAGKADYSKLLKRKSYSCNICGKRLRSKSAFDEHIRAHTRSRQYACHLCQRKCPNLFSLARHTKRCQPKDITGA